MIEPLSLDEIRKRAWSLHRPNRDRRAEWVFFEDGGIILGYDHPNEGAWKTHEDGFAFLSREGDITSVSAAVQVDDSGRFEITMRHARMAHSPAHILIEVRDPEAELRRAELRKAFVERKGTGFRPSLKRANLANAVSIKVDISLPEAAVKFLDPALARVFFVANNPNIAGASAFSHWDLGDRDVVVQYNRPAFFAQLAPFHCHKLHFFYPNTKACWGFSDEAAPELEYATQARCSLTFALAHWIPNVLNPYFASLEGQATHMAIMPDCHIPLYSYPPGRAPSCGFISIGLFRMLNLIRSQQNRPPLELIMIGFTGRYDAGKAAWFGHDFPFEQDVYRTWLELRKLSLDGTATT